VAFTRKIDEEETKNYVSQDVIEIEDYEEVKDRQNYFEEEKIKEDE